MSRFTELLDRFFYRPDEDVGRFLELAPEMDAAPEVAGDEVLEEFLAFELGGETYAVPIAVVREILRVGDVTEVPRAPPNVIGIINVRGEMLPLYDVKVRLALAEQAAVVRTKKDVGRGARIVLIRDSEGDAGILVDRVQGVVKLAPSGLKSAPHWGREGDAVAGLCRKDGHLFILLDLGQALS